jgi:hypothetical protein
MAQRYAKTEAGRQEIKNRAKKLSRHARNLLLIVDETHPIANWVQLVHGSSEADVRQLLEEGLIAAREADDAKAVRHTLPLAQALERLSYDQVYTLLTSQARDRLGLIRGYRFILDIERCANAEELRALAQRFLGMVEQHQGPAAAKQMRLALGAA